MTTEEQEMLERGKANLAKMKLADPPPGQEPIRQRAKRSDAGKTREKKAEAKRYTSEEQRKVALAYCVAFHRQAEAAKAHWQAEDDLAQALANFNAVFPETGK